jgi:hypothetical protein
MTLVEEIRVIQNLFNDPEVDIKDHEEYYDMLVRLASHLPSPSKINACAVLKSNSAEKIAAFLEYYEGMN